MGRILRYTIAGLIGAFLAWGPMELFSILPSAGHSASSGQTLLIGLISGLLMGFFLGIAEALSGMSTRDGGKCVVYGALIGAGGGLLGLTFGNVIYSAAGNIAGTERDAVPGAGPNILTFLLLLIGRGFGWALLGALIGLSQGIATTSTRKMKNGLVGGFIGGGIGGSLFEILIWLMIMPGIGTLPLVRFISFEVTGGAIGLFIGFVEEMAKRAWLIRLIGRNEGKEYEVFKASTVIGRSEYADIPVFDDSDIAERHAVILAVEKRHYIEDMGSFSGTFVNNDKVTDKHQLHDSDTIMLGKTKFVFHDKATAEFGRSTSSPGAQIPTAQHVCQFCGAVKDAAGNCDCTVGAASSTPPSQPSAQQHASASPAPSDPFAPSNGHSVPASAPPQPNADKGPRLVGVSGPYGNKTFILKTGETQIGRDAAKDIGLPTDNTVSRNHVRIAQEVMGYVLYDIGSTNGTFVNGAKVVHHDLRPGDIVQIGSTKFKFEI